jgi:hypothetical protein
VKLTRRSFVASIHSQTTIQFRSRIFKLIHSFMHWWRQCTYLVFVDEPRNATKISSLWWCAWFAVKNHGSSVIEWIQLQRWIATHATKRWRSSRRIKRDRTSIIARNHVPLLSHLETEVEAVEPDLSSKFEHATEWASRMISFMNVSSVRLVRSTSWFRNC